ncbi:CobT:nicotinate-nucleotide--dimethylbenzimidazole phosphoribosyltransferase [Desulfosarcina variabilis str. Montpellier]|uniref:nicotinate-nucleotide--dimethylbenzimidazole phosphoribosyltransferase n=1 Tax=Desulfosarcina variabilis TaxID=2300 RepID=UPI003AFB795C
MQLILRGLKQIHMGPAKELESVAGMTRLRVQYCGICRTDAKMWNEGHRDLIFPRVPGHELIGQDAKGNRFTVWPGRACGHCRYCTSGRENLCESMQIMGFHFDGGFSDHVLAPTQSLIAVPGDMAPHLVCFAEPVGCTINAIDKLDIRTGERVIIYGGGSVGLIAALVVQSRGGIPLVIEKNAQKIAKAEPFLKTCRIDCHRETHQSEFDAAINACPDPIAFSQSVVKLAKGGRLAFFSGLGKNQSIETNLLNLIHYREASLFGAYGLTRQNMTAALSIIQSHQPAFEHLVEAIVVPARIGDMLPRVLAGEVLKVILDFTGTAHQPATTVRPSPTAAPPSDIGAGPSSTSGLFRQIGEAVTAVEKTLLPAIQHKMDNKTKPLGALGRLEALAIQICRIQQTLLPRVDNKFVFVFAADHGITEEGVSAYPSEVTGQMVTNFLNGGAAINVLCRHHGIDLRIVDMGVSTPIDPHPLLIDKKVRPGTRNFALAPAMTDAEAIQALEAGMTCFLDAHTRQPLDIIGLGEMGIGNTTAASAIISAATHIAPEQATGRGTGVDDAGMRHKIKVIRKVLDFQQPVPTDGMDILCKVGGFEIAGMAGATLAAASKGVAVVLDGVISTAAGLIAYLIKPEVKDYLISGHRSVETAQAAALKMMGLTPVVDLDMRLGEGTGAALTMDIVDAACRVMREMASFDEAGVSKQKE